MKYLTKTTTFQKPRSNLTKTIVGSLASALRVRFLANWGGATKIQREKIKKMEKKSRSTFDIRARRVNFRNQRTAAENLPSLVPLSEYERTGSINFLACRDLRQKRTVRLKQCASSRINFHASLLCTMLGNW